jgi:hypothetical protein
VERRETPHVSASNPIFRARVANLPDRPAGNFLEVDDRVCRNLAGQDDEARRHQRFAGNRALRILGQNGVEDRVGNLISNLVGMSFRYGLRRKKMAAVTDSLRCAPYSFVV